MISLCEIWWENDKLDWQVETSSIYKKKSGRTGGIGFIVIERCQRRLKNVSGPRWKSKYQEG